MKTKDHALLAQRLMCREDSIFHSLHRELFLFGCVEPDINPLTYLRGSMKVRALRGHNADNVRRHIRDCIERLQSADRQSAYWYFSLGTLMHYIADSFTYPHNKAFTGSLLMHREYEKSLHEIFPRRLAASAAGGLGFNLRSPWSIFIFRHRQYEHRLGSMETDCSFIIETCQDILTSLLEAGSAECIAG